MKYLLTVMVIGGVMVAGRVNANRKAFIDTALTKRIVVDEPVSVHENGAVRVVSYIYIPSQQRKTAPLARVKPKKVVTTVKKRTLSHRRLQSHRFPWGQCTYWVATKRKVTWGGNANRWIKNARAQGYKISQTPKVGAIVQTSEGRIGHVAYVEQVLPGRIVISEMNFRGLGVKTVRELSLDNPVIRGYIW